MTDYELYRNIRTRLETVWREADRRARLIADPVDMGRDPETEISRRTGGKV